MGSIERFEDIEAWKKSRELNRLIYTMTGEGTFSRDFALRDQIRRASISVMSNIAEGFERGGDKEFKNFLSIAKASAAEVKSQLYIALDASHIDQFEFDRAYLLADESAKLIGGFMRYLSTSPLKGPKFK